MHDEGYNSVSLGDYAAQVGLNVDNLSASQVAIVYLIGQTASEFLRLYPSANILVATERDFEKSRRKQFISRIATGDYDCIIMSHSQFEKIPISAERKERMLQAQVDEIAYAIDDMKSQNGEQWTIKQMVTP